MGTIKKKAQDYFTGAIFVNGNKVCDIKGNYMGFIDFDGVRFWDVRDFKEYQVINNS